MSDDLRKPNGVPLDYWLELVRRYQAGELDDNDRAAVERIAGEPSESDFVNGLNVAVLLDLPTS